jgi:hypothetical protein
MKDEKGSEDRKGEDFADGNRVPGQQGRTNFDILDKEHQDKIHKETERNTAQAQDLAEAQAKNRGSESHGPNSSTGNAGRGQGLPTPSKDEQKAHGIKDMSSGRPGQRNT